MDGDNNSTAVASAVVITVTTGGNKCGHDPEAPRFFAPPPQHNARPKILQRIQTAIRDYYARPSATLPVLNAVNESERQQRSERREACCSILQALIHYTDLVTLRVGFPQADGTMAGLTMETLAKLSGLAHLDTATGEVVCMRRAERAIADLKAAGIITVKRQYEEPEKGVYKGLAAIRTVSKHLFTALGLGRWLEHERRRAQERKEKRDRKRQGKALGNMRLAVSAIDNNRPPQPQAEPAPARTGAMQSAKDLAYEAMNRTLGRKSKPPP